MNEHITLSHCFNVGVACEYGVSEAVLLQNIYSLVAKNAANESHYHDGRYWTRGSAAAFAKLFPYFTEKQVRYTLEKMEKHGLILVGNYNEQPFDQTRWYALTDKAYKLFGQVVPTSGNFHDGGGKIPRSIGEISPMDRGTLRDGACNFPPPIPDRNTDGTSDGNGQMETQMAAGRAGDGDTSGEKGAPTLEEARALHRGDYGVLLVLP